MPVVNYLWNPLNDNIVREFDDAGTVIAEYTTEAAQFGNVVSQRRSGQDSVYHYDGQGSTLALTDANGNVTDTYAYNAFGEVTAHTGSTANPFQYIGQKGYYWEAETNSYDVRRRVSHAIFGRWLSIDPLTLDNRLSYYLYVSNRPLDFTDPSGLTPCRYTLAHVFDVIKQIIPDEWLAKRFPNGKTVGEVIDEQGKHLGEIVATIDQTSICCLEATKDAKAKYCCRFDPASAGVSIVGAKGFKLIAFELKVDTAILGRPAHKALCKSPKDIGGPSCRNDEVTVVYKASVDVRIEGGIGIAAQVESNFAAPLNCIDPCKTPVPIVKTGQPPVDTGNPGPRRSPPSNPENDPGPRRSKKTREF